jgi:murein DD-endopeptidase MepM/ murein hydrolase activator NlpD
MHPIIYRSSSVKHYSYVLCAILVTATVFSSPAFARAKKGSASGLGMHMEMPVNGDVHFLAGLGEKRSGGRRHQGVDLGARMGTPVVAAWDGEVVKVGQNRLGGWIVRIVHPNGITTYYAHLKSEALVNQGEIVHQGEVIGYVGESGNARGTTPHLHFEMHAGKKLLNPLNYLGQF